MKFVIFYEFDQSLIFTPQRGKYPQVGNHCCMALPPVPLLKLNEAWGIIIAKVLDLEDDISDFIDYVGSYWIYNNRALFNRRIWNHYDNLGHRTNNVAEAFHSKLARILNKSHPNFYNVVTVFVNIQFEMNVQLGVLLRDAACSKVKL